MRPESRYLSRQELYQIVWSQPMTGVAKQLGLSDVGLAKACRRSLVPVPDRGYWAKRNAGKSTTHPSLPPRGLGMSDQSDVLVNVTTDMGSTVSDDLASPPSFDEDISVVTARVQKMVGKVTIPSLAKPHPLIGRLLDEDERRRQEQKSSPYSWNSPLYDSLPERRRLRILNALFLALSHCDTKPFLNERQYSKDCGVTVGHQRVQFTLEPIVNRSRGGKKAESDKQKPVRLQLKIPSWEGSERPWKSWEDGDSATIENQIDDIVVQLIVTGEVHYRVALQRHYEWRLEIRRQEEEEERRKKAEQERKERERLIKEQQARIDRLLGEAMALRHATDIRTYVEAVLAVNETEELADEGKLRSWATWALAEADRIDPIKSRRFLT